MMFSGDEFYGDEITSPSDQGEGWDYPDPAYETQAALDDEKAELEAFIEANREKTCGNDSKACQLHPDQRIREGYAGGCTVHPYEIDEEELIRQFEIS